MKKEISFSTIKMKGFSLLETTISIAILAAVTLGTMQLLDQSNKTNKKFDEEGDKVIFRSIIQKRLVKNINCTKFFKDIEFKFHSSITNINAAKGSVDKSYLKEHLNFLSEDVNNNYFYGAFKVHKIQLAGTSSGMTLMSINNDSNESIIKGMLEFTLKKHSKTHFIKPIEMIFHINTNDGKLNKCFPALYDEGLAVELGKSILGDNFTVDPDSGEFMVPVYNCCEENFPAVPALKKNCLEELIANHTPRVACKYISLKEAMCDLETRSKVPATPFCVL